MATKDNDVAKAVINERHPDLVKNWGDPVYLLDYNQVIELMEMYHDRCKTTPQLGGFNIKLQEHRLGGTVGTITVLLHPEDYNRVLPTDEKRI